MNKNNNKVFTAPCISDFKDYTLRVFNHDYSDKLNIIYLVKYNDVKGSDLPSHINEFYKYNVNIHRDGDIIYLPRTEDNIESCIIMYGRDEIKTINNYLGALISSKIKDLPWKLYNKLSTLQANNFFLGWGLEQYKFNNLKLLKSIYLPSNYKNRDLLSTISGIYFGKDLINIPSSDMGPDDLEKSFINFSNFHKLNYKIFKNKIIEDSYPLIYAVGRSSIQEPRLLELNMINNHKYPLVILVGKGVCFDTGGLNLKPGQFMKNMKKDMGGAASVLALGNILIESKLKINLKILIPAVDNDIGPNSMRPGDVYNSRSGLTVEIGNTDAEGRLILADALYYADSFKPNLLIDFATLTGAARVALGAELPAFFTNSELVASLINTISIKENDPLWRLPLWLPYLDGLKSDTADLNNISPGSFAGAITAGLFLDKFVNKKTNWVHIDTYAWNNNYKPGHSAGGDILGVRSIYKVIKSYVSNL